VVVKVGNETELGKCAYLCEEEGHLPKAVKRSLMELVLRETKREMAKTEMKGRKR
jgi:hypothetical protein